MAAEYDKTVLLELMRQPGNNRCIDCNAPSPQWASVNHGIFVCLNCSGEHRSLGVHISFVRSCTMDKWTADQMKKMQVGGNSKALDFFKQSPEYSPTMTITAKYNTHFASQYREKLLCEVEGRTFVPTAAPPPSAAMDSSTALRKPRAGATSGRASPALLNPAAESPRAASPISAASKVGGAGNPFAAGATQKAANENFFAGLGAANSSRPEDLPPSQGGRYTGFGSTPTYSTSSHPSAGLSSRALPSVSDLQQDPVRALSKGWGFLSAAVSQATKTVNESVIQPGIARAQDPNLSEQLYGYVSTATQVATTGARKGSEMLGGGLRAGSTYAKQQGYDVGDLGAKYLDKVTGQRNTTNGDYGYNSLGSQVPEHEYGESGYDDFSATTASTSNQGFSSVNGALPQSSTQAVQPNSSQPANADFFESHLSGSGRSTPSIAKAELGVAGMSLGGRKPAAKRGLGAQKAKPIDEDDWGKFD